VKRRKGASDDTSDAPADRSPGEPTRDLLDVVGSDLLDFGQLIIAGMKMTTGEGEPDIGVQFVRGHEGFDSAGHSLGSAVPDDRWDGTGARAYADQNTRQRVRAETMADADRAVHSVLVREALQIKLRRDTLDDQSDILAKTGHATFPLQFIPRYGEAAKLAIEGTVLQGALLASTHALYQLHAEVSANAAELGQAVGRYAGVADGADTVTPAVDFTPAPADGRTADASPSKDGGQDVFGASLAAGQAASAGEPAQADTDEGAEDTVTAEEVRDGDREDAAELGPGVPAPDGPSPDDTDLGEGVHVGG
jgi:hypothetical protein